MAKNILTWAVDHNSKIILYLEKFTLKPQLSLLRVANLRLQNCIISFSSIGISLYQNHADATRYSTCWSHVGEITELQPCPHSCIWFHHQWDPCRDVWSHNLLELDFGSIAQWRSKIHAANQEPLEVHQWLRNNASLILETLLCGDPGQWRTPSNGCPIMSSRLQKTNSCSWSLQLNTNSASYLISYQIISYESVPSF